MNIFVKLFYYFIWSCFIQWKYLNKFKCLIKFKLYIFSIKFFIIFYISRMSASILVGCIHRGCIEIFFIDIDKLSILKITNLINIATSHHFYQFYQIGIYISPLFIKKKEYKKYSLGLILQVQNKFGTTRNIDFI